MTRRALYVAEGPSDLLLGDLVREVFYDCGEEIRVSAPDLTLLPERVFSDVQSKIEAGLALLGGQPDVVIVHRDANGAGRDARLQEIEGAVANALPGTPWLGVVPCRATEAWLITNEDSLRQVSGSSRRTASLSIPTVSEAERMADPKGFLRDLLLQASDLSGRRRKIFAGRFNTHRRQLISRLTLEELRQFPSWRHLEQDVAALT